MTPIFVFLLARSIPNSRPKSRLEPIIHPPGVFLNRPENQRKKRDNFLVQKCFASYKKMYLSKKMYAQVRERPTTHRSNNMQMAPPIATGVVGHMKLSTPAMVSSRFRFRAANSGQSGPFHHGTACQSLQNWHRPQPPERLGVVTTRERP